MSLKLVAMAVLLGGALPSNAVSPTSNLGDETDLVELGQSRLASSSDVALRFAADLRREAEGDATQVGLRKSAAADWLTSAVMVRRNRADAAIAYARRGLGLLDHLTHDSALRGVLLLQDGNALYLKSDIQGAIRDHQLAYRAFLGAKSARGQAIALLDIAANYLNAGDYKATLRYCAQALEAYDKDPLLRLSAYNNAAVSFVQLGNYKVGEAEYHHAFDVAKRMNDPALMVQVLANIAQTQVSAGKFGAAAGTLRQGFAMAASAPAIVWRPALYAVAAQLALKQDQLDRAALLIDLAFQGEGAAQSATPVRDYHRTAYEIYRARGEPAKALVHLEAYKRLDDEARSLAASTSAALMAARFDFSNQDLKIARLRAGQAEQDATLARTRIRYHLILGTGLLGAVSTISVLLLIGYISISRSRGKVQAANDTLNRTNAELEKALAAKSEFLATTSHEIRTPLNGILGMTQVLLVDRRLATSVRERVELIHGAGETMRALVDDILDMAKMESGELHIHPAPMNLHRLLQDTAAVWSGQAETKRIALEVDLDECPIGIVGDEVRLRQIVFNLVSNAIKFTDAGRVKLCACAEPRGDGEALLIKVDDSGIGIPEEKLGDVFESFRQVDGGVTRRHGGTGLGLSISRNLARAMGGDVSVVSVLGTGSTFSLEIPLERAEVQVAASMSSPAQAESLSEATMLLIEPNPLSQGILRALLGAQVNEFRVATDIASASAPLTIGGVHHVLLDGAVFGLDARATARFAEDCPAPRISILWPAPDGAVVALFAGNPRVQLIAKPISAPDLLGVLRMGYRSSQAGRDIAA